SADEGERWAHHTPLPGADVTLEVIDLLATVLADETHGVNAQLALLDTGADQVPNVDTIATQGGDWRAAVGGPADAPALSLVLGGVEPQEPHGSSGSYLHRDGLVIVGMR